jgi:hypothetical protein
MVEVMRPIAVLCVAAVLVAGEAPALRIATGHGAGVAAVPLDSGRRLLTSCAGARFGAGRACMAGR